MNYTDQQLREALLKAHQDGNEVAAKAIAERLNNQRVSAVKESERGNMQRRWEALGQTDPLFPPKEAENMSGLQRAGAALDYGLENVAYGTAQLASHLIPGVDSSGIDEAVRDRESAWELGGLSDYPGATVARIAGEVGGYAAPGGAAVRAARAFPLSGAVAPTIEGAAAGTAEALTMPATSDNYWQEKGAQAATGAGIGGTLSAGLQAATGAGETVANTARRATNLPGELAGRPANAQATQRGNQLAQETGVDLTPAQRSESRALKFLEQRARESIFSTSRVAESDLVRANQFQNYVQNIAGDVNSAEFANNLQGNVTNFVRDLAAQRSKTGRQMYGEIDRLAQGQPVVRPTNLQAELDSIIAEAGTIEGGDVVRAAAQARKMQSTLGRHAEGTQNLIELPPGASREARKFAEQLQKERELAAQGYTAQEALRRLQNYSPYSKGTVFDDVSKGYDEVLKRRVYGALMKDMEETAAQGGTLGDMVKQANAQWRAYSQKIDAIHQSALGKMVGEEFATDLLNFNKVPPERVMDQFMSLRPSQAQYVAKFMSENMPDQLPRLRGAILQDAIAAAREVSATGGTSLEMNPGGFLRALGLTGNKRGGEAMQRLMHLFGGEGSESWGQMSRAIDVARRLADVSGKNFSGTSQANQFYELVRAFGGHLTSALKSMGSTALEAAGLRRIADSMDPASALFGNLSPRPLIQAPRLLKGAPVPASVLGTPAAIGWDQAQQ